MNNSADGTVTNISEPLLVTGEDGEIEPGSSLPPVGENGENTATVSNMTNTQLNLEDTRDQ